MYRRLPQDQDSQPRCHPVACGNGEPNAISNAVGYAKFRSRSHHAVIRVYDESGNMIETHEQKGDFKVEIFACL